MNAATGPLIMPNVPHIPLGTIALCRCRKAIHVTGHDLRNQAFWTHMADVPSLHYPSPLGFNHTLDDFHVQLVILRRENKKLRHGIRDLIRDNIPDVLSAFDAHEAGIYRAEDIGAENDRYVCAGICNFVGTENEWQAHLADKLADVLVAK